MTTPVVVAEAGWLIDRQLGPDAEATFYRSVATGDLYVQPITSDDWVRIAELVETYADSASVERMRASSQWRSASA